MVTCLTAWNMNNFKFTKVVFYQILWNTVNFQSDCTIWTTTKLYASFPTCAFPFLLSTCMFTWMLCIQAQFLPCLAVVLLRWYTEIQTIWSTRFVAKHMYHSSYTTCVLPNLLYFCYISCPTNKCQSCNDINLIFFHSTYIPIRIDYE
jgi:hypothetical protein